MSTNTLTYDHAVLQTRLLRDILQELRDMREDRHSEARSSVQLEQDSKGVIKPTVKVYDGSPVQPLVDEAMAALAQAKVRVLAVSEDSLSAWQQTLDMLNGKSA